MQSLIGKWNFIRTVDDKLAPKLRNATGVLELSHDTWLEKGTMDGEPFFQTYTINMQDSFSVSFTDGRQFYSLDDVHTPQQINHLCGGDNYVGNWNYTANHLALDWIVKGNNKNYTIQTIYTRI